ncbi:hypothetical protein OA848_03375 [Rickettsiales bacterium]|nr:hypothetical protein [Rickettsiales bacterium]
MVKKLIKKIKEISMARQITYLSDVYLITCVVENGSADKIVRAASDVGSQGATINYARGTGVRDRMGLIGVTIDEQKEIIRIIVSKEQSNRVFESMYLAGDLDIAGKGIMWMTKLDRVATYIPDEVLKRVSEV